MDCCSDFVYMNHRERDANHEDNFQGVDTNIINIDLSILKNVQSIMAMGDPVACGGCGIILNKFSKLKTRAEQLVKKSQKQQQIQPVIEAAELEEENTQSMIQKPVPPSIVAQDKPAAQVKQAEEEEEEKRPVEQEFKAAERGDLSEKIWECEFCGHTNTIHLEEEEIPKSDDVVYMVQSVNQAKPKQGQTEGITMVFGLDNSGSMGVTHELQGNMNLKHGLSQAEMDMLKAFIEPGFENQQWQGHSNKTYVSRKQCIIAAIENELRQLEKTHPERKIGFVSFNNEVSVIGDGASKDQVTVLAGDKLENYEQLLQTVEQAATKCMHGSIGQSTQRLLALLHQQEAQGQTALGPGLLACVVLAASSNRPGSMVILCTDGLANKGVGALKNTEEEEDEYTLKFYRDVGNYAKDRGVSVSVITVKGEECKIKVLGLIAEQTNGNVTRIDPANIGKDFADILEDEVIGTHVELQVKLHKALRFRNEDANELEEEQSLLRKNIGNATVRTRVSFEYELRPLQQLKSIGIDPEQIKEVPFQTKIHYTTLEGHRFIRVLSRIQLTSADRQQVEQGTKVDIAHGRVQMRSAQLIQQGRYNEARKYNRGYQDYMMGNKQFNARPEDVEKNVRFKSSNHQLGKATNQIYRREQAKKQMNQERQQVVSQRQFLMEDHSEQQQQLGGQGFQAASLQYVSRQMPQQQQQQAQQIAKAQRVFSSGSSSEESDEDKDEHLILQLKQGKKK